MRLCDTTRFVLASIAFVVVLSACAQAPSTEARSSTPPASATDVVVGGVQGAVVNVHASDRVAVVGGMLIDLVDIPPPYPVAGDVV